MNHGYNIHKHITFYASSEVVSRGRLLYQNKKVFFEQYSENSDTWRFTVLGSQKYHVIVKGVKNLAIQTSCSCPYD